MIVCPSPIKDLAHVIKNAGGRALLVGGCVRDSLLAKDVKDWDMEVYNLPLSQVETLLAKFGPVNLVGKSFGVFRLMDAGLDVSLPRRDNLSGVGHKGFTIEVDPLLSFEEAARRRDLTINSIGYDPLTGELLDPFDGRDDLEKRILRATDPYHFAEDPLRGMRVAQLAARLNMTPSSELIAVCRTLDLSVLSRERFWDEFFKLLVRGVKPSQGFTFLQQSGLTRFFPQIHALLDVPQEPRWHPEGDVWIHTLMVIDEAAQLRTGDDQFDTLLMFAALCHDFGKPLCTRFQEGRITSRGHEALGIAPAQEFLENICASHVLQEQVSTMVRWHLAPVQLVQQKAQIGAYRRLARAMAKGKTSLNVLWSVALADQKGRGPSQGMDEALKALEVFKQKVKELDIWSEPTPLVVRGSHLISLGFKPGPIFTELLTKCREYQDETGCADADLILKHVLAGEAKAP